MSEDRLSADLIAAVWAAEGARVGNLLARGADPRARDANTGLTVLMIAAGQGNAAMVRSLLAAGADVFAIDSQGGSSALHRACQGGSVEVVRLLLDAGAQPDWVAVSTGHTALIEAIWFKNPEIVALLLERGAGLNITTHYGFTLLNHLEYALNVNQSGRDKLEACDALVKARLARDRALTASQTLIAAAQTGDLAALRQGLAAGQEVDQRSPILNGFDDDHTPLLLAARAGNAAMVQVLIAAGADVNAVEPTFLAVPLHKATYNGHLEVTRVLAAAPGIDLDAQGGTNGYTPLHDALWHGFAECSRVLIEAGARLDLRGFDGKTPLDLSVEMLGTDHEITRLIRDRLTA
jgi:ankyrin repeat protein